MSDEITFEDCCRIILDDWRWRQDGIVPELLHCKRELLALLKFQEFDIDWSDERLDHPRDDGLPALVSSMPRDYGSLAGPFARRVDTPCSRLNKSFWIGTRTTYEPASWRSSNVGSSCSVIFCCCGGQGRRIARQAGRACVASGWASAWTR